MTSERLVWVRGELRPASSALVPLLSPTAQFGLNVFEGIRAYWNTGESRLVVFRLKDHLRRLFESALLVGIQSPYSPAEIECAIIDTLRAAGYTEDLAVRVMLFVDGEGGWRTSEPVEMIISPIPQPRRKLTDPGQTACTSTWLRIADRSLPPRVKAGAHYMNGRYAHLEARRNGYDVPILLGTDGHVAEAAGACIMAISNGVVTTPPVYGSILVSITRDTLIELSGQLGLPVVERPIDRSELYVADELFLCGTAAEVTPLASLDRIRIGEGIAGPLSVAFLERYQRLAEGAVPSHRDWVTPL
jgi:branched-chain amino acid aminotransferase